MKYKTTIKLITDARDKNEAMEIAGEYLSGNLMTGIDMKCRTTSLRNNRLLRAGVTLSVALVFGLLTVHLSYTKHSQKSLIQNLPGDSVIQPPLKTSSAAKKDSDFKREWQAKHAQEALDSIKK